MLPVSSLLLPAPVKVAGSADSVVSVSAPISIPSSWSAAQSSSVLAIATPPTPVLLKHWSSGKGAASAESVISAHLTSREINHQCECTALQRI